MRRPKHDSSCQLGQSLKLSRTALYVQTHHPLASADLQMTVDQQLATPAGLMAGDSAERVRRRER